MTDREREAVERLTKAAVSGFLSQPKDVRTVLAALEAAEAKGAAMKPVVEALEQARERFVGLLAEHSRMPGDTDDDAMASAERWTRTNEPWEGVARTYRATHMKENHG